MPFEDIGMSVMHLDPTASPRIGYPKPPFAVGATAGKLKIFRGIKV